MHRIIRDYIAAAIDRQKPQLECFIANNLLYPEAFPLALADPVVSIREVSHLKITPKHRADYPVVEVVAVVRVTIDAESRRRESARGVRTAAVRDEDLGKRCFAVDVVLEARGAGTGRGYNLEPRSTRLTAWWGSEAQVKPFTD